jgi:hypothetical protein
MRRRTKLLLAGVAISIAAVAAAPYWAPRLLGDFQAFEIERVEVSGMHLVAPHEVLETSGIRQGQSVWDDREPWLAAIRSHPGVADASIERVLPRTLRIRVEERRPIAFVEAEALRAATDTGDLLPVDPSRAALDLPLVRGAVHPPGEVSDRVHDAGTLGLLADAGRLAAFDPHLYARVSEVSRAPAGHVVLSLTSPAMRVLLPAEPGTARLRQLRAVLDDLEQRADLAQRRASKPIHVDLRFADQVVVRLSS